MHTPRTRASHHQNRRSSRAQQLRCTRCRHRHRCMRHHIHRCMHRRRLRHIRHSRAPEWAAPGRCCTRRSRLSPKAAARGQLRWLVLSLCHRHLNNTNNRHTTRSTNTSNNHHTTSSNRSKRSLQSLGTFKWLPHRCLRVRQSTTLSASARSCCCQRVRSNRHTIENQHRLFHL